MIPESLAHEIAEHEFICGSDEVGYGSWAGPLVVCAAVVHRTWSAPGVTDSKKLSPAARERAYEMLVPTVTYGLVEIPSVQIDHLGVSAAWEQAHSKAIQKALDAHRAQGSAALPLIIIDGSRGLLGAWPLPKADLLIPAVSAASIIAKVHRDRHMQALSKLHPGYGWDSNSGYGTPQHQEALKRLGVTDQHRKSYSPIAEMVRLPAPNIMDFITEME